MRSFRCRVCGNPVYFENSVCLSCGTALGYSRAEKEIVPLSDGRYLDPAGNNWFVCRNHALSGCTWLSPTDGGGCFSCSLTRTRPGDADVEGMRSYQVAEVAKRHLIYELDRLGFPLVGKDPAVGGEAENGLCFDLLSDNATDEKVLTGHDEGVITINLAESDDAYREKVRIELDEPYRTMLGHFRHEVGHYYEWQLVERAGDSGTVARARELFGDERADYQESVDRHYDEGPPPDWRASFISSYATMHPYEDFAETWAHYLHICDTIETADAYRLTTVAGIEGFSLFRDLVTGVWIPLSIALNMVNRSMGKDDLYPFVIPGPVLEKLEYVASLRPSS